MALDFNNPEICLQRARVMLYKRQAFFASLAMGLRLERCDGIPTMATDYKAIFYNHDFVLATYKKDPAELMSAVAHECGHNYLMHNIRQGGRDPELWNIAGDFKINGIIRDCGMKVGEGWLDDDKYDGWTTEAIYDDIKNNGHPQARPQGGEGDGKGQGHGHGTLNPQGCYREAKGTGPGGTLTADEKAAIERQVKGEIARAATAARMRGHLPNSLASEIDAILCPPEPWQDILREFITNQARDDYNWQRPSRQFLRHGFCLPSLQNYRMGPIVVALDTSGSVGQAEFAAFMANLSSIVEDCRPECVHVLHCDADVHRADEFTVEDLPLPLKRHGCGGTSFRPPFRWVDKHEIEPECLIYFTDTFGDFPDEPDYPVLWATVGSEARVPWGEQIRVTQ